jgi:hypothetical protein
MASQIGEQNHHHVPLLSHQRQTMTVVTMAALGRILLQLFILELHPHFAVVHLLIYNG